MRVFIICNAYESGYGHGLEDSRLPNPYTEGGEEYEAWTIGYEAGLAMRERSEWLRAIKITRSPA